MSGKIGYASPLPTSPCPQVLIPFMSGKIGYICGMTLLLAFLCLNPFYVREDWLHTLPNTPMIASCVLIPFMSGKIGYKTPREALVDIKTS